LRLGIELALATVALVELDKQMELEILENWTFTNLGDVVELKRGYDLPQRERREGIVPIVSSSGISGAHDSSKVRGPGVVTGRYGTIGHVFWIEPDFWPLNTTLYVRDFKGNSPRFISYFLQTINYHEYSDKAAVPGINRNHLHQAQVSLPPLHEQRAIAHILGTLDDKIENNRRMNETLEAMARAIFKSWFVDFDPVRAKMEGRQPVGMDAETAALFPESFEDSPMGKIPKGWKVGSIADLGRFVNGRNFTKNATDTGRVIVRIAELNSGIGGSTKYSQAEAESDNVAFPDSILFAWSGSLDVYRWHRDEALVNQHIFKVVSDHYPGWFVYYHLVAAMPLFKSIAAHKATTMGHIQRKHLSESLLAIPPTRLIQATSEAVSPIYDKIHQGERESQYLASTRDALLPKLLSGEIRVPDAEKWIEAGDPPVDGEEEEKPKPKKRVEVSGGDGEEEESGERVPDIGEFSTEEIMAEFRKATRQTGEWDREELLREVAYNLGYQRLGPRIAETLKGHLRAALRRGVLSAVGPNVACLAPTMADYSIEEVIDTFQSVMTKGREYDREEVIESVAHHLGFTRLRETVRDPIKSALNGAIRRGILGYQGNVIWREE
jgi:type I restriction enzyme S subunit